MNKKFHSRSDVDSRVTGRLAVCDSFATQHRPGLSVWRGALTALGSASVMFIAAGYGCASGGSTFGQGGAGGGSTGTTTTGSGGEDPTTTTGSDTTTTGMETTTTGMGGTDPSGTGGAGGMGGTGTGGTGTATCPKPAGGICHEFIANDNANNRINYINEFTSTNPGGVVWKVGVGDTGANSPRTIEIVDNPKAKNGKAVLVSLNKGYAEFDLTDGTFLARVSNFSNVTGACRVPGGNTALGINPIIRIVTPAGATVSQFNLPVGDNLRAINRNPADGSYWLSLTESIFQVSSSGQQLWKGNMGTGTKGYAVWWHAGGGAWATDGEPAEVLELNQAGSVIAKIGGRTKFPDLDFFSGFQRTTTGTFIVANWLGHVSSPASNRPHVVELTPDNKMIWSWGNQTLARQITNVYVFK